MPTWSISWAFRNLMAELLMPPGIWILLILAALFFLKKSPRVKKGAIVFSSLMIWVCSTNYFANELTHIGGNLLKWPKPFDFHSIALNSPLSKQDNLQQKKNAQQAVEPKFNKQVDQYAAIVILGGGRRKGAIELPEYQFQDVSAATMERLRMGARLAKVSQLPILVTGGAPDQTSHQDLPEAVVMQQVLQQEFNLRVQWVERQSNTTEENAIFSEKLLKEANITKIYLVTHFWHMPRARAIFQKVLGEGIEIVPVPTSFYLRDQWTPLDFYPSNEGFQRTRYIWHELIGSAWYRLKL